MVSRSHHWRNIRKHVEDEASGYFQISFSVRLTDFKREPRTPRPLQRGDHTRARMIAVTQCVSFILLIVSLMVHKFPDAIHPGIAARSQSSLPLKAVTTFGERVEIGLNAHPPKLLPSLH